MMRTLLKLKGAAMGIVSLWVIAQFVVMLVKKYWAEILFVAAVGLVSGVLFVIFWNNEGDGKKV